MNEDGNKILERKRREIILKMVVHAVFHLFLFIFLSLFLFPIKTSSSFLNYFYSTKQLNIQFYF